MAQPNQLAIEKIFRSLKANLLADSEVLLKLKQEFKSLNGGVADTLSRAELKQTMVSLAVKRLVCKTLQILGNMQGFCWAV